LNQQAMQPHYTADQSDWLAALDRRSRRQRRGMLLASGIAACLAVVAAVEALLLSWR
jgi:hypothetical protein